MMLFVTVLILLLSVVFEGTFFALPLVLPVLIVLQIMYRTGAVIIAAFLAGLFLDTFLFRQLGESSLFFLSFLTILALYERKFEVRTYPFLVVSIVLGTALYLIVFGSAAFLVQIFSALIFSLILFSTFIKKSDERSERLANR